MNYERIKMQGEMCRQEIDLRDYIKTIFRYWKVVSIVFLVSVILSAGMAAKERSRIQRFCKISVFVDMGKFDGIETERDQKKITKNVRDVIKSTFFYWNVLGKKPEDIGEASINAKVEVTADLNVVEITTSQSVKAQKDGKKLLNKITDVLSKESEMAIKDKKEALEKQSRDIREGIREKENKIKVQKNELEISKQTEKNLLETMKEVKNNAQGLVDLRERQGIQQSSAYGTFEKLSGVDSVLANIEFSKGLSEQLDTLARDKLIREIAIGNLERDIKRLQAEDKNVNFLKETMGSIRLVGSPKVAVFPININPKKTLVTGIIFGFFAGILAAFVMDFWERRKTKKRV